MLEWINSETNIAVKAIIENVPNELKVRGKCDEFGIKLEAELDNAGIVHEDLYVWSKTKIYSNKLGRDIGEEHYAIRIGDFVYDNLTPEGMLLDAWLEDLGLTGEFGKEIGYGPVDKIELIK
ncbi:MAG: hypothetical protein J1E62_07160 [Lachnospiraceae bacterium]|nr:hypothetical protein [Lachnospiraceae bacterium]